MRDKKLPYRVSDAIALGCHYQAQILHQVREGFQGNLDSWHSIFEGRMTKYKIKDMLQSLVRCGVLEKSVHERCKANQYSIKREELK